MEEIGSGPFKKNHGGSAGPEKSWKWSKSKAFKSFDKNPDHWCLAWIVSDTISVYSKTKFELKSAYI